MQARWVGFKQCWVTAADDDTLRTWTTDGTQLQQFAYMGNTAAAFLIVSKVSGEPSVTQVTSTAACDHCTYLLLQCKVGGSLVIMWVAVLLPTTKQYFTAAKLEFYMNMGNTAAQKQSSILLHRCWNLQCTQMIHCCFNSNTRTAADTCLLHQEGLVGYRHDTLEQALFPMSRLPLGVGAGGD